MREVAQEERQSLGLTSTDKLDPYQLANEHGIPVYSLSELLSWDLREEAHNHFSSNKTGKWSAMLVPLGRGRFIVENDGHADVRRRASIAHELGHHLLEHSFSGSLMEDHERMYDTAKEKQATFVAGELLVPDVAAFKAAYARWTNAQVAHAYGVSEQFAQMQMKGPRVVAQRSAKKNRRS
jgi:Zn-dependent peptidase ImmA (M78 family)